MIIAPVQGLNVQGYPGIHDEGLKPLPNQFRIKGAHFVAGELRLEHKEWATRDIDGDAGQSLVHRYGNVAIARDTPHIAECLFDCLAKRNPTIFGRVMLIDMQVSLRPDLQVDARMASKEIEHMIEKADAGRNRRRSSPVEVDHNLDIRFVSLALHRRGAHGCLNSVASEKGAARLPGLDFTIAATPPGRGALYQAAQASATAAIASGS